MIKYLLARPPFAALILAALLTLTTSSCGKSDEAPPVGSEPGGSGSALFDCDSSTCNSATQYCLISKNLSNDAIWTSECVPLPTACGDCDCTMADAPKHFPTSNNCKGGIGCDRHNSKITVSCYVPPFGNH